MELAHSLCLGNMTTAILSFSLTKIKVALLLGRASNIKFHHTPSKFSYAEKEK